MIYHVLLKIMFTLILVHYGTNLFDTVYCESVIPMSPEEIKEKEDSIHVVYQILFYLIIFVAFPHVPPINPF